MKLLSRFDDRSLIAALLLLAMHMLWLLTPAWGVIVAPPKGAVQWPIRPESYELEIVTKDEFDKLEDRSVNEITLTDGRKFVRTRDWHPILLEYYRPINTGTQFVRLSIDNAVFQELRKSDVVKLFIIITPAEVPVSAWG